MRTALDPKAQTPTSEPDMMQTFAYMGKLMADMSTTMASIMCSIGDRLGLFQAMAAHGPGTSAELAAYAGVNERYLREWLSALASAGYVDYKPASQQFTLPPALACLLAHEGTPLFLGGAYQQFAGLIGPLRQVIDAFRDGGGIPQQAYDDNLREGMERMSATWFEHALVQQWIPAMPEVEIKLNRGARLADIGCGAGRALIKLAQSFPRSRFVGYDIDSAVLARAASSAKAEGCAERVRFEQRDATTGLPEMYDVITTFDAVHDLVDPLTGLREIRRALTPDGVYVLVEMNCSENPAENVGPIATLLYATSVLYNLPVAHANGGAALGTMGLPEPKVRVLCGAAGFRHIRRVGVDNPFNAVYEIKP